MLKFMKRFINPFLCRSKGRFHTAGVFFETVGVGEQVKQVEPLTHNGSDFMISLKTVKSQSLLSPVGHVSCYMSTNQT